jgi:hypothetical protein
MKLLTIGNPKTAKGEAQNYLTAILHLAPARMSGYNVCPGASKACEAVCLNTAGRGGMIEGAGKMTGVELVSAIRSGTATNRIQQSRIRKTKQFFEARDVFIRQLIRDIESVIRKAQKQGLTPAIRLNGTSDIRWENVTNDKGLTLFQLFPDVQFYDYTKLLNRTNIPANYHLTFSRSEEHVTDTIKGVLKRGMNVAVVFRTKELPKMYLGRPVINGDSTDLRFLDGVSSTVVVGLKAKGKARHDKSGFVVDVPK